MLGKPVAHLRHLGGRESLQLVDHIGSGHGARKWGFRFFFRKLGFFRSQLRRAGVCVPRKGERWAAPCLCARSCGDRSAQKTYDVRSAKPPTSIRPGTARGGAIWGPTSTP